LAGEVELPTYREKNYPTTPIAPFCGHSRYGRKRIPPLGRRTYVWRASLPLALCLFIPVPPPPSMEKNNLFALLHGKRCFYKNIREYHAFIFLSRVYLKNKKDR